MAVQRWRLTFARDDAGAEASQRDLDRAWQEAVAGLGATGSGAPERPRLAIAAPLPVGMTAARELADVFVPERRRLADVRAAIEPKLPPGHRLVDLYDVWLGEPPLSGLVVAGDYRVAIAVAGGEGDGHAVAGPVMHDLEAAVATLLQATELPRSRARGDRVVAGNLRALIIDVAVGAGPGPLPGTAELTMRLRFHPSLGTGRPEEVVAALATILGRSLQVVRCHRERLWLRGDLPGS